MPVICTYPDGTSEDRTSCLIPGGGIFAIYCKQHKSRIDLILTGEDIRAANGNELHLKRGLKCTSIKVLEPCHMRLIREHMSI
jgi:hypothetical protein